MASTSAELAQAEKALLESIEADRAKQQRWRDENPEAARQQDMLLQEAHEADRKKMSAFHERARRSRETPIEFDPAKHADLPRCSITISGPPTLSLSSDRYHLTATLQHHSNPESQPITFRLHGSPIWEIAAVQGTYLLYEAKKGGGSETKEDDNVAAPQCFPEYNFDDDPLPVTPEHFATLQVGESMTRQLGLSPSDFELKPDTQYRLLMPHAYLGWWEYGEMEDHQDVQVGPMDIRPGGGLEIPRSNAIDITTTE